MATDDLSYRSSPVSDLFASSRSESLADADVEAMCGTSERKTSGGAPHRFSCNERERREEDHRTVKNEADRRHRSVPDRRVAARGHGFTTTLLTRPAHGVNGGTRGSDPVMVEKK